MAANMFYVHDGPVYCTMYVQSTTPGVSVQGVTDSLGSFGFLLLSPPACFHHGGRGVYRWRVAPCSGRMLSHPV